MSLHFGWVVDDMKCTLVMRVCVSVCLSLTTCPHYCTDPDITWENGRGCLLIVHYGRICNRCTSFVAMTTKHKPEMSVSAHTRSMPGCYNLWYYLYHWQTLSCFPHPHITVITVTSTSAMICFTTVHSLLQRADLECTATRPHHCAIFVIVLEAVENLLVFHQSYGSD